MLGDILKKYKLSLSLAIAFHAVLLSAFFINWQSNQEKSKTIVIKQGDIIKAHAVDTEQLQKNKEKKLAEQKRLEQEKRQQEKRKQEKRKEELRKKEEAKRQKEEKRKKEVAKQKAEKRKKEEAKRKAEEKRKKEVAKRKAEEKRKKEEAKRKAEEKRKKEEAIRKAEEKRKKEEAKRRADEEKARQEAIAAEEARLAAEQAALEARRARGTVNRYAALIKNKITRYWRRPTGAAGKLACTLNIRMTPSGDVVVVKVIKGSGNFAFDRAAEKAVMGASPLPVPRDKKLFEENFRNLTIKYEPVQ